MTNPINGETPELRLPPDLTEAQAQQMLDEGGVGRIGLEGQLGYSCCTIGGCLLPAGHIGACRVPDRSAVGGRKKTPKRIWEQNEEAPQQRQDPKRGRKQPSGSSRQSSGASSSSAVSGPAATGSGGSFATSGFRNGSDAHDFSRHIDLVPNMRAAPSFLDTNAQSHPTPFSPIADLMDNGIEAKASEMRVGMHTYRGVALMMMTDNGCGMTERVLRNGPLSLAYTFKEGTHYGMGATSSMPAIAGFSLIFSVTAGGHRTVGLLSSRLSGAVNADQTKMPQCTWVPAAQGDAVLGDATEVAAAVAGDPEAPLSLAARRASLALLLEFSPYKTEHDLLDVFAKMPPHGTRLVLWDLRPCYQPAEETKDVLNTLAPADAMIHETSLRGLLEVLYYVDDDHPPPLALWLMGERIVPRNWSRYLQLPRRFALPKIGGGKNSGGSSSSTFVEFGHRVELRELIDNFRSRDKKKDSSLRDYMGVFYYNRDADKVRLIVPLEKCKVQKPMAEGKIQMAVTQRRITEWGFGLLGVCVESHLRPAHNKREYASQATNSEVHSLMKAVDEKMRKHLKECVAPEFVNCTTGGAMGDKSPHADACRALASSSAAVVVAPAKAPPPARFIEGERVRAADGKEGRVCPDASAKGFYRLQSAEGTIFQGKRYRGSELTRCTFDERTDLPRGFVAAPDALDGVNVEVYWLEEEGILGEGSWERGRLVRPVSTAHNRGWFTLIYDDQEVMDPEQMFFALPTAAARAHVAQGGGGGGSSATCQPFFAVRPDGERLYPEKDVRILDASVAPAGAVSAGATSDDAVLVQVDADMQSGDEDEVVDGEIMIDSSEVFVESADDEMEATIPASAVTAVVVPLAAADAATAANGDDDAAVTVTGSIDGGGGEEGDVELDDLDGIVVQESDVPLGPSSNLFSSAAPPPPAGRTLSAASRETARAPPPASATFRYPRVGLRMSSRPRAPLATPNNGSVCANGHASQTSTHEGQRPTDPDAGSAPSNGVSTGNVANDAHSSQPPASMPAAPSAAMQPSMSATRLAMVAAAQQVVLKAEPPTAALAAQRRAVQALPLLPSDVARHRPVTTLAEMHAAGRRRAELVDASTQADMPPPTRHDLLGGPAAASSTTIIASGEAGEEEEVEEEVEIEEEEDVVVELRVQLRARDEALAAGKERERQLQLRLEALQAELVQSRENLGPTAV